MSLTLKTQLKNTQTFQLKPLKICSRSNNTLKYSVIFFWRVWLVTKSNSSTIKLQTISTCFLKILIPHSYRIEIIFTKKQLIRFSFSFSFIQLSTNTIRNFEIILSQMNEFWNKINENVRELLYFIFLLLWYTNICLIYESVGLHFLLRRK